MKKIVLHIYPTLFFIISITGLQAQDAVSTTGGKTTGGGGSVTYTVGQVTYTTNTASSGSVSQGVQQPFEISVETGVEQKSINLECAVYPNPVTDYLILTIENDVVVQMMNASSQLTYQLYDINGKLIEISKVVAAETKINTDNLEQGNYLLRVVENDQAIKIFKIIKN